MALDLQKGMRKVGEAQSAVISQQVTLEAQAKKALAEAEREQSGDI